MKMHLAITGLLCSLMCASAIHAADNTKLVGHWKLQGDCKDYSGSGNNGVNHGVDFSDAVYGRFDGSGAYIEVPNTKLLKLGKGDFSISAWIKCNPGAETVGDILSKYDGEKRKGFNFHVTSSAPGYSSTSDTRNVLFGIDDGADGVWRDCGRPKEDNSLVSVLVVYKNHLYAGIADAVDPLQACHMYRYEEDGKWTDCGRVSKDLNTPSIMSAVIHNGALYVGTGKWDYGNLATSGEAGMYRYMGGRNWKSCGSFSKGKRIISLASFGDGLYASDDTGATHRYNGDDTWTFTGTSHSYKFLSTMVYRGDLYGGASTTVERFDGKTVWNPIGEFDGIGINQIHTFCVYGGNLYTGTWPDGLIMRYDADGKWTDCGWLGSPERTDIGMKDPSRVNEINDLTVYNGKMYAGVIPKGELWRYDGGQKATMVKRLVNNPDYKVGVHDSWCRVPGMAIYKGRLFAGTSTARGFAIPDQKIDTGKVFSCEIGKCVTIDDDIGTEWRLITAVREGDFLKLYLDGRLISTSSVMDKRLDLTNDQPLLIGFGAANYFNGSMKDIRLYSGALTDYEITELYEKTK
ncbi:MAG: LamG-like jellyroll fold domain-containing protein [Armatimonadota bacterium]